MSNVLPLVNPSPVPILRLKIRLLDIRPTIWRRILVPATYSLQELHGVIQVAMGWNSIHLYRFHIDGAYYGSFDLHVRSAKIPLSQFGFRKGAKFCYEYDMGDFWQHELRVEEERCRVTPGFRYPACTGGAHACPPENCGGPEGYRQRRQEATGMDAFEDYETMVEAIDELVIKGNQDFFTDERRRWQVERALERTDARQDFLSDEFSMTAINDRFRQDEHQMLMHQQY